MRHITNIVSTSPQMAVFPHCSSAILISATLFNYCHIVVIGSYQREQLSRRQSQSTFYWKTLPLGSGSIGSVQFNTIQNDNQCNAPGLRVACLSHYIRSLARSQINIFNHLQIESLQNWINFQHLHNALLIKQINGKLSVSKQSASWMNKVVRASNLIGWDI